MDYEQKNIIEQELVKNYPNLQNAFYTGKLSEDKLTNYVTQPFWHSLHHSKRNVDRNGVILDTQIVGKTRPPRIKAKKKTDEVNVREYHQKVWERKKVYLGNKCIYNKKDRKLYNTSVIDIRTDEEEIVCPNCGAKGPASTFVDGCDFCNTKFVITKSANKISSFSAQNNIKSKTVGFFVKLLIALAIIAVLIGIAIVVSFMGALISSTRVGWYEYPELKTALARVLMLGVYIFPEVLKIICITLLLFGVVGFFLIRFSTRRIDGESVVQDFVRDIVPESFAGNLEHKLRSIHFAENKREIATFTTEDLGAVLTGYSNILDTSMNKMTFIDTGICSEGAYVDVEASLDNLRLINSKVKAETEKVKVRLLARTDMKEQSPDSVEYYRCNGCGGSVDLYEGGFCISCGTPIDYGKYDWIISKYESLGKVSNTFRKMSLLLVGILVTAVVIIGGIFVLKNRKDLKVFINLEEAYQQASSDFHEVKLLDEVCEEAEHIDGQKYDIIWMEQYESKDVEKDLYSYIEYLDSIGFKESEEFERGSTDYDNVIRFERRHYFDYDYLRSELSMQIIILEYDDNGDVINVIFDVE